MEISVNATIFLVIGTKVKSAVDVVNVFAGNANAMIDGKALLAIVLIPVRLATTEQQAQTHRVQAMEDANATNVYVKNNIPDVIVKNVP